MIDVVAIVLKNKITGLPYVQRYGGVVKPISEEREAEDGRIIRLTYPVPVNMTEKECFEQGKYTALVPDDSYLSVSYIEQLGGAGIQPAPDKINAKDNMLVFRERFRFVCWLQLAKFTRVPADDAGEMPVDEQGNYPVIGFATTSAFEMAAIKAIKGNYDLNGDDTDGIRGKLSVSPVGIAEKNPDAVFGKYSYANKEWAFLHPNDYFAIDFEAYILIPVGCVSDMVFGEPLECVPL